MLMQEDIRIGKIVSKAMGKRFWGIIRQPDRNTREKRAGRWYEIIQEWS